MGVELAPLRLGDAISQDGRRLALSVPLLPVHLPILNDRMPNQEPGAFRFLHMSHPNDSASWKGKVRSHAAKNAVVRQKRVANYQSTRVKADNKRTPETSCIGSNSSSLTRPSRPLTSRRTHRTLTADPFCSFAFGISAEQSFLLHHFVNNVVGKAFTCLPFRTVSDEAAFRMRLGSLWVQMSIADPGVLASVLLSACRHLAEYQDSYRALIFEYRGRCLADINDSLSREGSNISDFTIVKTLAVASDSIVHGEKDASRWHLQAATAMVASRGGVEAIESHGFLGKLVMWILKDPMQQTGALLTPSCLASAFH
ncbi:fungal specific transcription factor domain-containing protein [Pochonia chlamydosporia 170]|uniref:Fungal specific transcription factor domain-containing protein n=1 Tax=Pochonia chlamydosporia 170 TaxID=1380566 RepID=A0A179FU76_METCM|nr:fungal specific transcription factor domain-containing protein [Pochonia chlamydosporia 170]OAQ69195.1 fungal specific transcription factor domain-containing protein [Pochonia chlamydosporia 170]